MMQLTEMFNKHRLSIIPRHLIKHSPESVILDDPIEPQSVAIKYSSIYWVAGKYSEKIFRKITKQIGPHTTYILDKTWEAALHNLDKEGHIHLSKVERSELTSKEIQLERLDSFLNNIPKGFEIKRIDKAIAKELYDTEAFESRGHIHPYGTVESFLSNGIGFVLLKDKEYVGAASSIATAKSPNHEIEIQVDRVSSEFFPDFHFI